MGESSCDTHTECEAPPPPEKVASTSRRKKSTKPGAAHIPENSDASRPEIIVDRMLAEFREQIFAALGLVDSRKRKTEAKKRREGGDLVDRLPPAPPHRDPGSALSPADVREREWVTVMTKGERGMLRKQHNPPKLPPSTDPAHDAERKGEKGREGGGRRRNLLPSPSLPRRNRPQHE